MNMSDVNCSSSLSGVERAAILTALKEATNALTNYRFFMQKQWGRKTLDNTIDYIFYEDEFGGATDVQISNRDFIATMKDLQKQMAYLKVHRDSLYVERMLKGLIEEVYKEGNFLRLIRENESISGREYLEKCMIQENEETEKAIVSLRKSVARQEVENEGIERCLTEKFLRTQKEKERLKVVAKGELEYVTAWEKARCEQNSLRCKIDLDHLDNTLKNSSIGEKNENRVSTEVMAFLIQNIATIEEQIELWRQRYEREKMAYEKRICQAREEIEVGRTILKELRDEYHSNQEFIDTYLAEKEAMRKLREEEDCRRKSATKIQAWWRGVMVRRKLGPYRPEEKKKKRLVKTKK